MYEEYELKSNFKMNNYLATCNNEGGGINLTFETWSEDTSPGSISVELTNSYYSVLINRRPTTSSVSVKWASTSLDTDGVTIIFNNWNSLSDNCVIDGSTKLCVRLTAVGTILTAKMIRMEKGIALETIGQIQYTVPDEFVLDVVNSKGNTVKSVESDWVVKVRSVGGPNGSVSKISNLYLSAESSENEDYTVFYKTLNSTDIENKYITLPQTPVTVLGLNVLQGPTQYGNDVDFTVEGKNISWSGLGLEDTPIKVGNSLRVMYTSKISTVSNYYYTRDVVTLHKNIPTQESDYHGWTGPYSIL
jgi:hypothetical protein